MSSSDVLGISTSALMAFQQSLDTISHNIANANTDGYSRQQVQLGTNPPQFYGGHYLGQGVQVEGVTRAFNGFVNDQLTNYTATSAQAQSYANLASQVDNLLSSDSSSLSPGLQKFFNAVQDVATDPTSIAARQSLISQGQALTDRFHALNDQLNSLRKNTNGELTNDVGTVNQIAGNIAQLNQQISATHGEGGSAANDLLDKRDALVRKLAGMVSVRTVTQNDGSVNVFIGTGQALVNGGQANTLKTAPIAGTGDVQIQLSTPSADVPITDQIQGGKLGALLQFRSRVLNPAQNGIGREAIALSQAFNAVQNQGVDLNGDPVANLNNGNGANFFANLATGATTKAPRAFAYPGNSSTATPTVTVTDATKLTTADYQLQYDGTQWSLKRTDNGQTVALSGAGTSASPLTADGLSIVVPSGAAAGDRFLIQPTRAAAGQMSVVMSDPKQIAAATTTAVGDNSNALNMAKLANTGELNGGTTTFADAYSQLETATGTETQAAKTASDTQQALLQQAQKAQQSVSGVNLDQEASDLMRYQQSYQAAAQVISTANSLFQTLIHATGG